MSTQTARTAQSAPDAVIRYVGRAGDRNDAAVAATAQLADALGSRLSVPVTTVAQPRPPLGSGWEAELDAARADLRGLADRFREALAAGAGPVAALTRCAAALATLPEVARAHPGVVVVWFDAHADLNTPTSTPTGYLGGLALSGPLGLWDSGLGAGVEHAVLVGTRDVDPEEQRLVADGAVGHVPVGGSMAEQLADAVAGRPVYVHIDCDVLEPGTVPTEYQVPDGMTLAQLEACAAALVRTDVVGLEVAELQASDGDDGSARRLVTALEPLLAVLER